MQLAYRLSPAACGDLSARPVQLPVTHSKNTHRLGRGVRASRASKNGKWPLNEICHWHAV